MRFIDEARVYTQAGKGGDGAIAFLREKYRPFGGPAGGDGGRGGSVIFQVDEGLATLLDFKYTPRLVARDGEPGRGKQQYGHHGEDLVVRVPPGTVVFDEAGGQLREIREASNHYLVPRDACLSYRELYQGLQALEEDLHQHMFLENYILFPRAAKLELTSPSRGTDIEDLPC